MRRHVDVAALYSALDAKREGEGISWRELAAQTGLSSSTFTRLAQGGGVDVDTFVSLCGWLGTPTESFITGDSPKQMEEETLAVISSYLRADKALKPKSASAIETVLRAAYAQLSEPKK
jgi:transcriptional regulator with XRE-family HTH domain